MEQFARASIQLFRLEVPQKIGSILASHDNSQPHDMKPPYHVSFSAPHTFDDIMEYVDYLIDARKSAMTTLGGDNGHLDELHGHIRAIYADVKSENPDMSALLRCAFVHADLVNPQNVLVTPEGDISGIIDWEFHLIHPAILAVEYPAWLLYDGIFDPRSAKVDLTIWLDSPEESARLRVLYKEVCASASTRVKLFMDSFSECKGTGCRLLQCVGARRETAGVYELVIHQCGI